MHDLSTTTTYAALVAEFKYDPLDAGGIREAEKISRPRDEKGRFVATDKT